MARRWRGSDCKAWSLGRPRSRKIEEAVEALSQGRCWIQFGAGRRRLPTAVMGLHAWWVPPRNLHAGSTLLIGGDLLRWLAAVAFTFLWG